MAKFFPLLSGSRGNCTYIEAGSHALLVDCGGSFKAIREALIGRDLSFDKVEALLITHEHTDHISALGMLLRRVNIPVYSSVATAEALRPYLPAGAEIYPFEETAEAGVFPVRRFNTSHDCPGSSGYRITLPDGREVAVCTDLGVVTDEVRRAVTGCEAVCLESNHDLGMLCAGSYPEPLKRRILSETGHLSNTSAAAELPGLVRGGATRLILGHLSRQNNRPDIAAAAARASLFSSNMEEGRDCLLYVAEQTGNRCVCF